jgi:hypothetical protein
VADEPYFTPDELRAAYPELANEAKYPDAKLEAARTFAEQWFETAAHVAYVPRTATETLVGTGSRNLFLSRWAAVRPVVAASIDGAELAPDELAALVTRPYGVVERTLRWLAGATILVTYRHGYDEPAELARTAVMMLAVEHAKPSTIPARATSISTDLGSYRISQADATGRTGIPDVDAIIALLGADKPATGAGA